jgi:hypothetical protein
MDKQLGLLMAQISDFVYTFDATLVPGLGNPVVVEIQDHKPIKTSFAGLLRYPDKMVLAFEGTITGRTAQAVLDWLQDFRALQVQAMGLPGMVHKGFADQLTLIWPDILAGLQGNTQPLYVTGHSQGAAVAVLATKALELAGIAVAGTYTFAAPRPGDEVFAASVATPVFRFEFGDDVVPHVPFHSMDRGKFEDRINTELMAHVPELGPLIRTAQDGFAAAGLLNYRRPGTDLQVDLSPDDENTLARTRNMLLLVARTNLFNHHHMINYIGMFS